MTRYDRDPGFRPLPRQASYQNRNRPARIPYDDPFHVPRRPRHFPGGYTSRSVPDGGEESWRFGGRYDDTDYPRDRWPPTDQELAAGVRRAMLADVWLDSGRIEVEVDEGVVTLHGEVSAFLEARYAWDDAWETPGVRGVVSRIEVIPRGAEPNDESGPR